MTATAEIEGAHVQDAVLIPNGALRFTPFGVLPPATPRPQSGVIWGRVWTDAKGKPPAAHDVRLGASDGHATVMLSGDLKPGDIVLTSTTSAMLAPPSPGGS